MKYSILLSLFLLSCYTNKSDIPLFGQASSSTYKWWTNQKEQEVRHWSVRNNKNILWKFPLQESGQSGIIKVKNKLYFSIMKPVYKKGIKTGADIVAQCYNADTGQKLWEKEIKGSLKSPYMYGFSNSSSPTPASDGERVYFINASGRVVCFSLIGEKVWERVWEPLSKIGRVHYPFNKQYEPILYGDTLLNVEPLVKKEKNRKVNSHYLFALNKLTGEVLWKSEDSIGHYNTPMMGFTKENKPAVLIARVGKIHKVPEKPYGYSLIDMNNGKRIWQTTLPTSGFLYNSSWNKKYAVWLNGKILHLLNSTTGKQIKKIDLSKNINSISYSAKDNKYIKKIGVNLNKIGFKVIPSWYTNFLKEKYYYFMTFQEIPNRKNLRYKKGPNYSFCRVNLETSLVEYLEVPVDTDDRGQYIWRKSLRSDTTNIRGIDVAQDKRGKLNGWYRCFNASPVAVNSTLYFTVMSGMVYTFDMTAEKWNEKAFIGISDMGKTGTMRTLSQPLISGDRVFHRTAKELFSIKVGK